MKEISVTAIRNAVKDLSIKANRELGQDTLDAFVRYKEKETSPVGRDILDQLIENARIAREEGIPMCQDTGLSVIFVDLGQEVHLTGGDLSQAINDGVRDGYQKGYLRKSTCHPFTRKNIGDNTPAIIHLRLVPGDKVHLWVVPKGGGSENMSRLAMLPPCKGLAGAKELVIQTVKDAGPNPCPPIILGVGIGGNFEVAPLLAKRALLRQVGERHPDPELAAIEEELLEKINNLGWGPQGLGGRTTALDVHLEMMPCHIASFPVAVNIQCHANRHLEVTF
ncbi:MAG: fumarate hydratase [Deltaproteobacteria bacterium]|nr:fumarate hydratase [Deltaproteobacteria bacterium]